MSFDGSRKTSDDSNNNVNPGITLTQLREKEQPANIVHGFIMTTRSRRRLATTVYTESELSLAIASDTDIVLGNDITLDAAGSTATALTISGVTGLTIDGAGFTLGFSNAANTGNGQIFLLSSNSEVEMRDKTLANGYSTGSGGAIYITGSILKLTSCPISDAKAVKGGAIYSTSSTVTLTSCTISNALASNANGVYGGAIYSTTSTITLTSCIITDATARYRLLCVWRGDIFDQFHDSIDFVHYHGRFGVGTTYRSRGGAICAISSTLTLSACTLSGGCRWHTSDAQGGAIYTETSTSTLRLTSCIISGATASGTTGSVQGGAIYTGSVL